MSRLPNIYNNLSYKPSLLPLVVILRLVIVGFGVLNKLVLVGAAETKVVGVSGLAGVNHAIHGHVRRSVLSEAGDVRDGTVW